MLLAPILLFSAVATTAGAGAASSTSTVPTATAPSPVQYADLQLQVSTGSDWTTVHLLGAALVDSRLVSSSPGSSVSFDATGVGISNATPSSTPGENSSAPETTTANLVYRLPTSGDMTFQICRGYVGETSATLSRLAPDPSVVSTLTDTSLSGWTGSCYDAATSELTDSSLSGGGSWPTPVSSAKHVLAVYYPWWESNSFDSPPVINGFTEGSWPDIPQTPYDTTSASSVAAQVSEAASDGIDGFILEFNGDSSEASYNRLVTAAAEARSGFYVTPMVDLSYLPGLTGSFTAEDQAQYIYWWTWEALEVTSGHAQLTQDGRPVVFYYDSAAMSPTAWQEATKAMAQAGDMPYPIGDATGTTYGMPGLFSYGPNSVSNDSALPNLYEGLDQSARFDSAVGNTSASPQLLVAPVSPGMNNTEEALPSSSSYDVPRDGGVRYNSTWSAALASRPDWILVSTWNEWVESTGVAPSVNAGTTALVQTGDWASIWRSNPDL